MRQAFIVGFVFVGCYIIAPIPTCLIGAVILWRKWK